MDLWTTYLGEKAKLAILTVTFTQVDTSGDLLSRAKLSSFGGTQSATTPVATLARSQTISRVVDSMVEELQVKPLSCVGVQIGNT